MANPLEILYTALEPYDLDESGIQLGPGRNIVKIIMHNAHQRDVFERLRRAEVLADTPNQRSAPGNILLWAIGIKTTQSAINCETGNCPCLIEVYFDDRSIPPLPEMMAAQEAESTAVA